MRKFLFFILALLILSIGLHTYAYLFSNFMINSALEMLKNNKNFKIENINKNSSIFSTNLNFALIYKDFNLDIGITAHHNAISVFRGLNANGDIKSLEQNSTELAKIDLNIPINSDTIYLNANIFPIKFIENHSSLELSDIAIEAVMDSKKLYLIKSNLDNAALKIDDISANIAGVIYEIDYIDGLEFASFDPYKLNSNNLNLNIENIKIKANPIDIVGDDIKFSSKTSTKTLANIMSDLASRSILINGVAINDFNFKIGLENIDINGYKDLFEIMLNPNAYNQMVKFMDNEPKINIYSFGSKDIFDLKFKAWGDKHTLTLNELNFNGEFSAYKPLSSINGLEFISMYEKFLISNGVLIQNDKGYMLKFKSDNQNRDIIFNNSVKFSDILLEF